MTGPGAGAARTNALISVLGLSSQQIASFVITLIAAGFLGVADYGVYTLALVFFEFTVMLTYAGYFHFVVNSDEQEVNVLSTMFWIMLGIGAFGGVLMFLCAGALAALFDTPQLAPVLRALGILQPFASAIGWASAALTRAGLMRRYFLVLIGSNLGGLAAGIALLMIWPSVYALVLYRAVRIVLGLALFGRAVPIWPQWRFDRGMARRATRYASGLYGARFLGFFANFGTDLILAYLFTTAESGLYRFANRLATATVDIIAQPLRSYALKSFGAQARAALSLGPVFAQFFAAMLFLTGGFAITLSLLGGAAIELLFRPEYIAGLTAMQALALRAAARTGQSLIEPVFAARSRTAPALWANLIITAAMLGVIFGLAPLGFATLAWGQAAVQVLSLPLALFVIGRYGAVPLGEALQLAAKALALLTIYAALLASIWWSLPAGSPWQLAGASLAALLLAAAACLAAQRWGVLRPSLFADTSQD